MSIECFYGIKLMYMPGKHADFSTKIATVLIVGIVQEIFALSVFHFEYFTM